MTTYDGTNTTEGVMFDIRSRTDIEITGFDIHTNVAAEITYEIYTKEGSHMDSQQFSSSWKIISSGTIRGMGESLITNIPQTRFESVKLKPYSTQSFYITLLSEELIYTVGSEVGAEYTFNPDLSIMEGIVVEEYPFGIDIVQPCVWNGIIHYLARKDKQVTLDEYPTSFPSISATNSSLSYPTFVQGNSITSTTFLYGFSINYLASTSFLPSIKKDIDSAILFFLRTLPDERGGQELKHFFSENNIRPLLVNAIPVDIDNDDGK